MGMGIDVKARLVHSGLSVIFVLSSERRSFLYIRGIYTLEVRLRSYLDPMLKLDVLLTCVSKGNTSYWFNTLLVVSE